MPADDAPRRPVTEKKIFYTLNQRTNRNVHHGMCVGHRSVGDGALDDVNALGEGRIGSHRVAPAFWASSIV